MTTLHTATLLLVATLCASAKDYKGSNPEPWVPQPLFLTPYIDADHIYIARELAAVMETPGIEYQVGSFAGFLTVNKTTNSNMFFWFFPVNDLYDVNNTAPVLLWLQGGPGASSLFALFSENGPYIVEDPNVPTLSYRNLSWTKEYNVLYIDNPVGTGYSFTDRDEGYAKNQEDVARDLFEGLQQFFKLFPELQSHPFYATGESYAGKYVPSIGYKILQEQKQGHALMNFQGIIVGDGLSDPETQLAGYGQLLYQVGMLDQQELDHFESEQAKAIEYIRRKQFGEAFDVFDTLLNGDLTPYPSYFFNVTGSKNYFNYLLDEEPESSNYFGAYVTRNDTRLAIHVGNLTYNGGQEVEKHLRLDVMDSVKPWLEYVVENSRVLLYSGSLDVIVGAPLTEAMIASFTWSGAAAYQASKKEIWRLEGNNKVAGYWKNYKNFNYVVIRNAGHMVPYDQPEVAYHLIQHFIDDLF